MTAIECCLIEVFNGVPKVGRYLVAGRRLLASLLRQTPSTSFNPMSCPNQRLLFRPLRTEVPRQVEFSRTPVLHALVRPAVSIGLPADLTNTLNLEHHRLRPHLDEGPAGILSLFHGVTVRTRASSRPGADPEPARITCGSEAKVRPAETAVVRQ
jgi:hypothetical protein